MTKPHVFRLLFASKSLIIGGSAHVSLAAYSKNDKGDILLTPECTRSEFDEWIDYLKEELEQIRKQGHKNFNETSKKPPSNIFDSD